MSKLTARLKQLNPAHGLKAHIALATAGIAILLSMSLSYWAAEISTGQIENRQGAAFAQHAHHTAEMLDRGMFERFREMQVAAELSDIQDPDISLDTKRELLERMQGSFNAYAWIGICDDKGQGLVGTGHYLEGKDLSGRPWCSEGREKPYVGDVHDALLLAKILPNPSHQDFYLLDVAAPVHKPDGSLLGVLCGHIFWNWAEEMLNVSEAQNTDSFLINSDGLILAGPEAARSNLAAIAPETMRAIRNQSTGHVLERWGDGKTYLTGYAKGHGYREYPGLGWIALYRQDATIAFAPADNLQLKILLIGGLMGLFFAWLGWLQAGRIARPIQAITRAAEKVASGDFRYIAPPAKGDGEVSHLATAIDQMTTALTHEIAERTRTEEKLRKISEAVQQAGEAVMITDQNGIIEYVNPACCTITGYASDELIGKTPALLKSEQQDPAFYKELWRTITGGEVWHGTLIDRRKDGSHYHALMSVAPIHDHRQQITHFVSIQQDMTENKKLEQQFVQSQKMEALGTLVGGIAHDFNNMLAGMTGNLYLAKKELGDHPDALNRLSNVEELAYQAADMIRQLLTFARKESVEQSVFDFSALLVEISKLSEAAIPESTRITTHYCNEPLMVKGNPTQLQQVVLNLFSNAQHAIADRPEPRIEVNVERFETTAEFRAAHPDATAPSFAHLSVRDNGIGITPEDLDRVLEPFFTTKEVGKGTGLGLPMVYGSIQSHRGVLALESTLGEGTTVHIYLPLTTKEADSEMPDSQANVVAKGNGETILLADDEAALLETNRDALEELGYRVLTARDGKEAAELFAAHSGEVVLAILDVVMPNIGGVDAANRMRNIRAELPVIFLTGYDRKEALKISDQPENSLIMNKPLAIERLSRKIRTLLQAAR